MAIDTARKRASALSFGFICTLLVVPQAGLPQADQQTCCHDYAGILASIPTTPAGPLRISPVDLEAIPLQQIDETLDHNFVAYCTRNFTRLKTILTSWFLPTSQTTVGPAGTAQALPANPQGYFQVEINGVIYVVPYYKQQ